MRLNVLPIPAFKDNYIWMLVDESSRSAWAVDPGEADQVLDFLKISNYQLAGILLTHHHHDHSGGIAQLNSVYHHLEICGAINSKNPYVNHPVSENQSMTCLSLPCQVIEIPGHTLDHLAFYIEKNLFCGDTLFSAGCGKIFEGTAAQMFKSLQKLASLSDDTQIFCGHEYTLANLNFASQVDPKNQHIQKKLMAISAMATQNPCTLPSTLSEEKMINPFLRCDAPEIISAVSNHAGKKLDNPLDVFYHLREWKNNYQRSD